MIHSLKPLRSNALSAVSGSKRVSRIRARNKVTSQAREAIATKAVAYVRVSTEEQATHGHGLEAQDRAVRAFAESQGYELVEVVADPGASGATRPADRPGFAQILELAAGRRFVVLLVYKFDRLARDIRFAVTTVSDLAEQHGVVIRSVTEPIDTATPMGRTLFAILAGMAENEREAITERTKGGRITKASKGGFAGGAAPYGYERDREGGLRIVEAQARVVRRIFRERRQRRTLQEVADGLNADGIPAPRGGKWRHCTVAYVADNPKYKGAVEYLFGETHVLTEGAHQAIV
jgi:site-specific DNA recombinase